MFENVEGKLKTLAKVNLYCGFILAVISFIFFCWPMTGEEITFGDFLFAAFIAVMWVLVGFITSWPIYAFAEIVEGIKETNKTLKYIFQDDIRRYQGIEHKQEEQKQRDKYEAERLAKKMKEDRFAAYWSEHAAEKKALLDKKAKAEAMLKQLDGKEHDTIQALIQSIDEELTKDR